MPAQDERPSFIADAMLGRLARSLRMLGLDVSYSPNIEDSELKATALRERRVILTRDHEVARTGLPVDVVLIESDHVEEQLRQVASVFTLPPASELFTRCLVCNVEVEETPREGVRDEVPPYVYETQRRFARCHSCGRIYWAATHVEHAREWLDHVLGPRDGARGREGAKARARASTRGRRRTGVTAPETNVFVTGKPGIGKTTIIERVLEQLDVEAGGFYTREIREGGSRVGFSIVGLHGERGMLAHVDLDGPYRVGRYGVNRDDLERVGVAAIERAMESSDLIVMDEIGRMELCSEAFRSAVMRALDSRKPVFGTIQARQNEFLDSVRARADVEIFTVGTANRECLVPVLRDRVMELLNE